MVEVEKKSRRNFIELFLKGSLLGWLGAILYPVAKYLVPPQAPDLNVTSVVAGVMPDFPLNSSKIIRFGRKPVIVVRKKNGDIKALGATCTHLDCTVQYKADTEQIWCACHNGIFNLEGMNISGPPPKPLTRFFVKLSEEKIIILKEDVA